MKNIYKSFFLLLSTFLAVNFSCNTTEPPPPDNGTLTISLTDVSCTEAWVNLKTNGVAFPVNVNFSADGNTITRVTNLGNADTTVYIDSLLPNKSYQLQAQFVKDNQTTSSNKITVQTLDTTSNNFIWETYTFGDGASSVLNDVAVINENDIWAVGEIYMNDSTGNPDPHAYNAVHWDGTKWKVTRIKTNACGGVVYPPIQAIFAFSSNDILFAHIDGSISHYNGVGFTNDCSLITQLNGSVNKIWGSSKDNFYVVSNNGFIAHYNGSSWQKIESGTTTNINDIWGINNGATGTSLVLATVSSRYHQGDYKLLTVSANSANEYFHWPYTRLYGLWFNSPRVIYIAGSGAYTYKNNNELKKIELPTNYFLTRVKANGLNDIYISGCCNTVVHFNGISWALVDGIFGNYEGMDVKDDLATVVGWTGNQAIIVMIRRQ